jgi:hypothetical protein
MRKLMPLIAFIVSLALVSTACSVTVAPTEQPGIATIIAGTMAALNPQTTETPQPTVGFPTVSPTEIPSATPFPTLLAPSAIPTLQVVQPTIAVPNATRISFVEGATSASVSGSVQAGAVQNYVLGAMQGQPMIVNIGSPNNDVLLGMKTAGGTVMLNSASGQTSWQGSLPLTEDYYLFVHGAASTENFTLSVTIPSRIKFLPGAISAKVSGKTIGGNHISYVAYASQGQKMIVDLSNLSGDAAITIWGFADGSPYVNANMHQTTHFTFTLPRTQDYIIEVVPQAGSVVSYTLSLQIQ